MFGALAGGLTQTWGFLWRVMWFDLDVRGIGIEVSAATASDWQRWCRIAKSAETCVSGTDHSGDGGGLRHGGGHALSRGFAALCRALPRSRERVVCTQQ